jgi:GNAT superfamily N-acetyltransferase
VAAPRYRVERLGRHHNRAAFACGEASLDSYLRERARQDDDRNVAKVFVLVDEQEERIVGYYTLSASSVQLENVPLAAQRALPRYPHVPVVLLGRLAIDQDYQGRGLGEVLLFDALRRGFAVGTQQIAAVAVIVDALHERARAFYERYGFQRFSDDEYRLFLPMWTIAQLIAEDDAPP